MRARKLNSLKIKEQNGGEFLEDNSRSEDHYYKRLFLIENTIPSS